MAQDLFNNTDGTPLTTHNALWVKSGMPTASSTQYAQISSNCCFMSTGAANEWIIYYHASTPPSADYSASVIVNAVSASPGTGLGIRISPSSAHDSSSKGYLLTFLLADGGTNFGLLKKISGTSASTIASMSAGLTAGAPYKFVMQVAGSSTTTITCKVQDFTTSLWLTPAAGWQVGEVACLVGVDTTSPITAAGHGGISLWGPGESVNDGHFVDNFNVDSTGGGGSAAAAAVYYLSQL